MLCMYVYIYVNTFRKCLLFERYFPYSFHIESIECILALHYYQEFSFIYAFVSKKNKKKRQKRNVAKSHAIQLFNHKFQ